MIDDRRGVKLAGTASIKNDKVLARNGSANLEEAAYKLLNANVALRGAIRTLCERYPELVVLANNLPITNGEHPYLRIKKARWPLQ